MKTLKDSVHLLGSTIKSEGTSSQEIQHRLAIGRVAKIFRIGKKYSNAVTGLLSLIIRIIQAMVFLPPPITLQLQKSEF